ncbi:MAG: serine/threonine protein kinase, partial [Nonomuraea sp.]|nr:serine/threonine protein kinase [Nonomuraea sp.]
MVIGDRYELDDLPLGQGGMGAVYAGHDRHLDRRVAVKLLRLPSGPDHELERRFIREARILARLEHPGAPVLYDFGTHEQRLFQV